MGDSGGIIIVQGKQPELDVFDWNYIIVTLTVTIGGSLISLIMFNICGIKAALRRAVRRKPYSADAIRQHELNKESEDENGAAAEEVAVGGWHKTGKNKYVHASTLSFHSLSPDDHRVEELNAGKENQMTRAVVCPHGCRAVGNRGFQSRGRQTFLWVNLTIIGLICINGCSAFSYVETQKVLTEISPNSRKFEMKEEYFFRPDPDIPELSEHSIMWCRGIPMIQKDLPSHTSCDNSSKAGLYSTLVIDECQGSVYYHPSLSGFITDSSKGHPSNKVCGYVMTDIIEINGTLRAFEVTNDVIKNHAWGVSTVDMYKENTERTKRALQIGDEGAVCFGGGGGLGFVAVAVYCDLGGVLSPYKDAINSLFDITESTNVILRDTIEWSRDHFEHFFEVEERHTRRIHEISTTSAYTTIYALQVDGVSKYESEINSYGLERRQILEDRDRKLEMQSQLDILTAGQRSGHIITGIAQQIVRYNPTITPQILLGTDLCQLEVVYGTNQTWLKFEIAVVCPDEIKVKTLQVEVHPKYCVRVDTACRCQNFRAVIYDSGSTAQLTDVRDAQALMWPFKLRSRSVSLLWQNTGTVVPETAVTVSDNTFLSVRDVCPPAVIIVGNWGTLIHCGLTCLFSKYGKSVTNVVIYDDRLESQSLTGAGINKVIPRRLTKSKVVVLTSTSSVITTSQTGKYEANTANYQLLAASEEENENLENIAMAIQTNRNQMIETADELEDRSQDLEVEIREARKDFNNDVGKSSTMGFILFGVAMFVGTVSIILSIVAICYTCKRKDKKGYSEKGNNGYQMAFNAWYAPERYEMGMKLLGMIMNDGSYFDAEKGKIVTFFIRIILKMPILCRFVCLAVCVKSDWPSVEFNAVTFRSEAEDPNLGAIGGSSVNMRVEPHVEFKRKPAKVGYKINGDTGEWTEKGGYWWLGDLRLTSKQMNMVMKDPRAQVKYTNPYMITLSDGETLIAENVQL